MPTSSGVVTVLLLSLFRDAFGASISSESSATPNNDEPHSDHPVYAVLFPWFAEVIGVCTFFILSRYLHFLPFTAVMFLIGTFMGVAAVNLCTEEQLQQSVRMWANIDGHVLLAVFLPGLLFKDSE